MNPHNKDEFAAAWAELDDSAEIRAAFEQDDNPEHKPAKYGYRLIDGKLEKIDGQSTQTA